MNSPLHTLIRYMSPQRGRAWAMATALLTGIGLQLAVPQVLRSFIDLALGDAPLDALFRYALFFLFIAILQQALRLLATWLSAEVGWAATNQMREDLSSHCMGLDMQFHHRHTPGAMIERIDGDVTNLSNFFSQFVVHILGNCLLTIGILALLMKESIAAGSSLTVFTIMSLAIVFQLRRIAVPINVKQRATNSRLFGFMEEKMSALEDIRANGGGEFIMRRFYETNHDFFHQTRKAWMTRSMLWIIIVAILVTGNIIALAFSDSLYQAGSITAGTVVLFFFYIEMLRTPIEQITRQLEDFQNAGAGLERSDELLGEQSTIDAPDHSELPQHPIALHFDHLHFSYREDEKVLDDIHFDLPAGTSLGVLGRTGSGKTTLARLLFRLYDPQQGDILFNGDSIKHFSLHAIRSSIGMVTQEVQLFQASIRDNISFFDPEINDNRILEVLTELGLQPWIARMPEGLDTQLESGTAALSSGEAQLLACARIFLKDPGLLILDEPTSRMDPVTQQLVRRALDKLMQNRTTLVIAHRLSTIEKLDSILILEDGGISEFGPQTELRANPDSRLHELLRMGLELDA